MSHDTSRRSKLPRPRQTPSGRWSITVERGVRADGSRRTMTKTFDTKDEAQSWAMAMAVELDARPDLGAGVTLRQLWGLYKVSRRETLAKKTMAAYSWYMEGAKGGSVGCWLDWIGDVDASTIGARDVQRRLDAMPKAKAKHAKTALSSVLSWAARNGLIARNPLHGQIFEYRDEAAEADPFDDDPFAAIEGSRDVWSVETALACFERIRGLPLEPAWLACVGAGLRVEESLALRKMDVRRVALGGHEVTQLAIHAARTDLDRRKATKTAQSRRIVAMLEPFGARYWELASDITDRKALVCEISASRQNKAWRRYFWPPSTSKHAPRRKDCNTLGRLYGLPYVPLSKMRGTHVTIMAESGVSDSINALMHGHTEMVERRHYLAPDVTSATLKAAERFRLVG